MQMFAAGRAAFVAGVSVKGNAKTRTMTALRLKEAEQIPRYPIVLKAALNIICSSSSSSFTTIVKASVSMDFVRLQRKANLSYRFVPVLALE